MSAKKAAFWGVPAFVLLLVVWVAVTAAGVGGEASQVKEYLDQAVSRQAPGQDVRQKLAGMGYDFASNAAGPELDAQGPHHSLLLYGTWLTVKVTLNPAGSTTGYHIDRADRWL